MHVAGEKKVILWGEAGADICLIQPVNEYEKGRLGREVEEIQKALGNRPFVFAAFEIEDWNRELSPWRAPAVFNNQDFGAGAQETLSFILEKLRPEVERIFHIDARNVRYLLGGYSLAGLFALWAGYRTDAFYGIAAASPSVWFPEWDSFMEKNIMQAKKVSLSLGDREEKAKNPVMAKVAERICLQHKLLAMQLGEDNCTLEWNPGNHFRDTDVRMAAAFSRIGREM